MESPIKINSRGKNHYASPLARNSIKNKEKESNKTKSIFLQK